MEIQSKILFGWKFNELLVYIFPEIGINMKLKFVECYKKRTINARIFYEVDVINHMSSTYKVGKSVFCYRY